MPSTSGRTADERSRIALRDFSAGAGRCEAEHLFCQCVRAAQSMSQTPLRGYFLWVGGALLVLLFAADSLLPAPLPSKLIEIAFYASADPDHLRVGRDRKQLSSIPASSASCLCSQDKEIAAAPSPPLSSDSGPMLHDSRPRHCPSKPMRVTRNPAISTHVRETLAQLGPGVSDQAGSSRRQFGLASESPAQSRSDPVREATAVCSAAQFRYHSRMRDPLSHGQHFVDTPSLTSHTPPVSFDRELLDVPHVEEAIVSRLSFGPPRLLLRARWPMSPIHLWMPQIEA